MRSFQHSVDEQVLRSKLSGGWVVEMDRIRRILSEGSSVAFSLTEVRELTVRVLRHNHLLVATWISGPAHNLLGLDFTKDLAPYVRDLAAGGSAEPQVHIEMVRRQVQMALEAYAEDQGVRPQVVGIQYLSTDTPSDTVYELLAKEILGSLSRLDELDTFEPTWSPS